MAGKRLGSTEADGELCDLESVEEAEAFRLATLQQEREGRSRTEAVAIVNVLLARPFDHAEIAQPFDLLMLAEIVTHLGRVLARALHPQFHGFQ